MDHVWINTRNESEVNVGFFKCKNCGLEIDKWNSQSYDEAIRQYWLDQVLFGGMIAGKRLFKLTEGGGVKLNIPSCSEIIMDDILK